MGRLPENKLNEIRESADLVDVISEYIQLKKSGANYKALCPFHQEHTPSFMVNPVKQIFHCFGCSIGGNVFTFIMKIENVEFIDSLKILAKRAGIEIEKESGSSIGREKEEIYNLIEFATKLYNKNLLESKEGAVALEYLKKRNIKDETITEFKLGFALNSWDSLINSALKKGFKIEILLKAGLILKKEKQASYYDRFRNRIIFPISDLKNRTIGFGARVLDDSLPKYINSPDTIIYHKGDNLYAWSLAKDEAIKKGYVILVEGYFDCIMCYQEGIKNVVAVLGTSLTKSQSELLKRYIEKCIILFDVDIAGIEASIRGINVLVEKGFSIRIASIESGKDPDEFLRTNSKDELVNIIENSKDIIEYKLSKSSIKNVEDKVRVVKELLPVLSKMKNMVEKGAYVSSLSEKLRIADRLIWIELSKVSRESEKISIVKEENYGSSTKKDKVEIDLLKIILTADSDLKKEIFENISFDDFENENYRKIAEKVYSMLRINKKINVSNIIDEMEDQNLVEIVSKLAVEDKGYFHRNLKDTGLELIGVIKKFKDQSRFEVLRKEYVDGKISREKIGEYNILLKKLKGWKRSASV